MAVFLVLSPKDWLAGFRFLLLKEEGNCDRSYSKCRNNNKVRFRIAKVCRRKILPRPQEGLLKSKAAYADHTQHTVSCSFLEGWGAKAGAILSVPNSTLQPVLLRGQLVTTQAPFCEQPSKQTWALPSANRRQGLDSLGLSGRGAEVAHSSTHSWCRRGLFLNTAEQQEGAA